MDTDPAHAYLDLPSLLGEIDQLIWDSDISQDPEATTTEAVACLREHGVDARLVSRMFCSAAIDQENPDKMVMAAHLDFYYVLWNGMIHGLSKTMEPFPIESVQDLNVPYPMQDETCTMMKAGTRSA